MSEKEQQKNKKKLPYRCLKLFLKQLLVSALLFIILYIASSSENMVAKACTSALSKAIRYETDVKALYNSAIGVFNEN